MTASFWLGLVTSKMSAVCLTQISFGAAGISGGMQAKDGYTVIKSIIKSSVTSVTAPHGFATWVSSEALGIAVIANESKRDIFIRCGDHVSYFLADDSETFNRILERASKRAQDRIKAAKQLPNDKAAPELKAISMAFEIDKNGFIEGREFFPLVLSNIDFSDYEIFMAPPCGWTGGILEKAINCPRAKAFRTKWSGVDAYLIEYTETEPVRHWIGSSESY